MIPTGIAVGRIVHYVKGGGFCYAAIITGLNMHMINEGGVCLTLFKPDGIEFGVFASYSERAEPEHWHWPEKV